MIAVGARFSDRVVSKVERFAPKAKILHIDIDEAEVNKNVRAAHYIVGDVKAVLAKLNQGIRAKDRTPWLNQVMALKAQKPRAEHNGRLTPGCVLEKIYELTGGKAIITTEVGQHQIWTAQYYKFTRPRTLITSGGLGTMGFGLGAAIGASVALPGNGCSILPATAVSVNLNELATAVEYKLPVIVVIMNNHALGMVRQWQSLFTTAVTPRPPWTARPTL